MTFNMNHASIRYLTLLMKHRCEISAKKSDPRSMISLHLLEHPGKYYYDEKKWSVLTKLQHKVLRIQGTCLKTKFPINTYSSLDHIFVHQRLRFFGPDLADELYFVLRDPFRSLRKTFLYRIECWMEEN